jgi:ribosomal protein S18 acetylase RimI-like enzyme
VIVAAVEEVTPELVRAFARLLPQLSPAAPLMTAADLQAIVGASATTLLVAREGSGGPDAGTILGSTTLVVFRIPGGLRARIESVVVDGPARGRGVGEALCRAAIERARSAGVALVDLESSPEREAANRLYLRLGFERRGSNPYRLRLGPARAPR